MRLRYRICYAFSGALLAFGLVLANLLVLTETTGVKTEENTLVLLSAAAALCTAAVLMTPRPVLWTALPVVLTVGALFFFREELGEEAYRFCVCLTRSSLLAPVLKAGLGINPTAGELSGALYGEPYFWLPVFAAFLCGVFLLLFLSHLRGCLWFSVFDALVFAALAVFMNRMPSEKTVVLFIALNAVLALSSLLTERSAESAGPVILGLILPCLLLSFGIKTALPRYERPEFADRIVADSVEWWKAFSSRLSSQRRAKTAAGGGGTGGSDARQDGLMSVQSSPIGAFPWNRYADRIDLELVGPRRAMDTPVMELYSDSERTIYLRGVTYAQYGPDRWAEQRYRADGTEASYSSPFVTDADPTDQLRIRMAIPTELLWLPYTPTELPAGAEGVNDSYVLSPAVSDYSVFYKPNAPFAPVTWQYRNAIDLLYLEVPEETRAALEDAISQFDPDDPNLVYRVAEYVRTSADYDTDTPAMPDGEDFVPWFLYESDTGYCVHFASAAAVLLRCLSVPARYVTGYMVHAEGSQWTEVTEDDAHAWVEYFDDSLSSWRVLETTPSVSDPEEEEETESAYPAAPLPNLRNEPEQRETLPESAPRTEPAPTAKKRGVSVLWLLPVSAAALAVLWPLVRSARRKARLAKAGPNERAAQIWRLASALLTACKCKPPAGWKTGEEIALKARFSPHGITPEELTLMNALLDEVKSAVKRDKTIPRRIAVRWFYGV